MPVPIKTNDFFKPIAVQQQQQQQQQQPQSGVNPNQTARERLFGSFTQLQQQQQQFIHQHQQNQVYQSLGIDDHNEQVSMRPAPLAKPEVRASTNER
jgi:hypothetical protein